jgi:dual oxidase
LILKLKILNFQVYFLWVTKTQKHFEWFVDILRELENADSHLVVSVHIFVTQFYEKFDLRTILLVSFNIKFNKYNIIDLFCAFKLALLPFFFYFVVYL